MVFVIVCLFLVPLTLVILMGVFYFLLAADLDESIKAICVPCWHQMFEEPPPEPPTTKKPPSIRLRNERRRKERCSRCRETTNGGVYLVRK